MSDWRIVQGVHSLGTFEQRDLRFDNHTALALADLLGCDVDAILPSRDGPDGLHFHWRDLEWEGTQLMIIQHVPSGDFWVHDWCDSPHNVRSLSGSPDWRGSWLGMSYRDARLDIDIAPLLRDRVWPGWNLGFVPSWVHRRQHKLSNSGTMLWAGTITEQRDLVRHLPNYIAEVYPGRIDAVLKETRREEWLDMAARFSGVLCLPGGSAWNNREVDCWGCGIPTVVLDHGGKLRGDPSCFIRVEGIEFEPHRLVPLHPERAAIIIHDRWLSVTRQELHRAQEEGLKYYDAYCTPLAVARGIAAELKV